jgi:O-antigen ligase
MSTFPLSSTGGPPDGAGLRSRAIGAVRRLTAAERLGLALLVLVLYAAFAHGAVQAVSLPRSAAEPRLQVAVAAVAAITLGVWLWGGSLRLAAPRTALAGLVLLAAFTVWIGVSLAWSVSPDGTWLELNRYVTYTIVLALAIIVGASARRPIELVHGGFLVVAALVTCYALGQKLVPWVHIPGVIDLNHTGPTPRLQEPFGYWNALGLFLSIAVPMALAVCVDRQRSARLRLAAVVLLELIFLTIGFTYSRGGLVALALGIVVALWFGGARLRGLLWLALAAAGTVVPLLLGLLSHALTTANVGLSQRSKTGAELAAVVIISLIALVIVGRRLLELERTVRIGPARARAIARGLIVAAGLLVLAVVVAVGLSHRGLTGTISHAWHSFTSSRGVNATDPAHLLSADSGNRWVWWKEAVGAFSARPLGGWGAGSFPVVHLLYRRNDLGVLQPHSAPLQFLAETGVIGAVLAIAAFLALLGAGARSVRRLASGRERMLAAALLGALVAYGVHACYDWDADIPGLTLPVLVFAGVLAGAAADGSGARHRGREAANGHLPIRLPLRGPGNPGLGLRLMAIVVASVAMCAYALSAVLPSLAASKAYAAEVRAGTGTPQALRGADQEAALATRLDPLSDDGLLDEEQVALDRQQLSRARALVLEALRRDPADVTAWERLAYVEVLSRQLKAGISAAQRVLQLDPEDQQTIEYIGGVAAGATAQLALPQNSPTDLQTPQSTATATAATATTGTVTTP